MSNEQALLDILKEDFEGLHLSLRSLEQELQKYTPSEAISFIRPLKGILFEARLELGEWRSRRTQDGGDIINSIKS